MSTYTGELDCYMPENNSERGTSGLGTAVCNPGTKPDSCRPEGHEARTTERAAAAWRAVVIRKHKLRKANRVNKRLVLATSDEGESNGVRKKKTRRNPRPNKRERMARAAQKNAQEDTPMLGIDTGYVAQDRVGAEGTKAASPSSCIPLSHTRRKSSTKDDDLINTLRQKLHDHEAFLRQLKEAQIQGSISLNDPCFMARKVRAAERLYVTMQVRLGREERTMSTKRRRCCRWP
ncbi:MAG: hypothetical protein M1830_003581 [Pleopsidium flavum]|nr:MAG: hypothetical protein M1830_003581 [Pleopsidium flavum]